MKKKNGILLEQGLAEEAAAVAEDEENGAHPKGPGRPGSSSFPRRRTWTTALSRGAFSERFRKMLTPVGLYQK